MITVAQLVFRWKTPVNMGTVHRSSSWPNKNIRGLTVLLASCRKPSSGLTSGTGRQYVKACPIRGSFGSLPSSRFMFDKCRNVDKH